MPDIMGEDIQLQLPLKCLAIDGLGRASQLLAHLNSATGITCQDFQKLFAKCDSCSGIMTRHAFPDHKCNVIDLTTDSDSDTHI